MQVPALLADANTGNDTLGNLVGRALERLRKAAALDDFAAPTLHHAPLAVGLCLLDGHFECIFKRQPRLDKDRLLLQQQRQIKVVDAGLAATY